MNRLNKIQFHQIEIEDAFVITSKLYSDNRGTFIRIWEENNFFSKFNLIESSIATNPLAGTLRGLHYQTQPYSENKIVQCVSGKIYDVILDLRKNSKTYKEFFGIEIGPNSMYQGLLVPKGCAHGYLTLEHHTIVAYFIDQPYSPEHCKGILWNDINFNIKWPINPLLISEQDLHWPFYEDKI